MTVLRRADGRETTLHADRTTLGRAPSCDVVLDDPAVAPRHASILRTDRGWLLVDESGGGGVWVDRVAVANHFLRDGETLRLGATELRFSDRGATLVGTPRPQLRPALELEGLRRIPAGARASSTPTSPGPRPPSSTPTTPAAAPPSSTPTLEGRASSGAATPSPDDVGVPSATLDDPGSADVALAPPPPPPPPPPPDPDPPPSAPARSGATVRAPIDAPPPFASARKPEVPRTTASIYEAPSALVDPDERPFVAGAISRRTPSVYTMGDDGPRASLDPVVDVYTLGHGSPGASPSVYSMGTAPTSPGSAADSAAYSFGEAETILGGDPAARPRERAPAPPPPLAPPVAPPSAPPLAPPPPPPLAPPPPSGASVYSMGSAPDGAPASTRSAYSLGAAAAGPARGPARRPGESWSWVRPEPARTRARGSTLGRPGRGLVTVGLVLVVLGLVLAAVAFGLGLTVDEIRSALGGGR